MVKESIIPAYATPIWQKQWPDAEAANEGLKALILERAEPPSGAAKSNIGGWHSETDFLTWGGPHIDQLLQWIQGGIQAITKATGGVEDAPKGQFYMVAWANVLYTGGYNQVHDHYGFIWSGVYYADVGDPTPEHELAGVLEFIDPRVAVSHPAVPGKPFRHRVRVAPEAGQMVMFPSWLLHYVHPYLGQRPRISIAFNVGYKWPNEPGG